MNAEHYPFGARVTPRAASASTPCALMVVGAYPSALHVEWIPPAPWKRIRAIPVDDEPTPFWDGENQSQLVAAWKTAISFRPEWGTVQSPGGLNGSSGSWVRDNVLGPLGAPREGTWITDCLDTYRASTAVGARLADTYAPFAASVGLRGAWLAPHPSENAIVGEALSHHRERLLRALAVCRPERVVTLGNAALRVLRELVDDGHTAPRSLGLDGYGRVVEVRVQGRPLKLLPLAHPAAPERYQQLHATWRERIRG